MTGASRALLRRAVIDSRVRTITFAVLFAVVAVVQVVGYRRSYPTAADRALFAQSFGDNAAVRLFYGMPHDLLTTGGYVAWRVGATLAVFGAVWGLMSAVATTRAEEDAGRQEVVLAGAVTRRLAFATAMAAVGVGALVLGAALVAGLVGSRLALGGSLFLALATLSPLAVFAGVGAVLAQVMPTRRLALEAGTGLLVAAFLARVVADTAGGAGWLRWLTPFGWAEEARAFADPRPEVLLLPLALTVALMWAAGALSVRRDIGRGLLPARDSARPRTRLLSSPTALALRTETGGLAAWLGGIGFFAVIVGVLSDSFSPENISADLAERLRRFGGASLVTPEGALGLYFLFFVLVISLFAASQIAAARAEEASGRLETTFALPVGRRAWLIGRLALAAVAAAALAMSAGVLAWVGAATQGADVDLGGMLAAGANCLPASLLFLGLGALGFALAPRAATGVAYGLVCVAFVWELVGAVLGVPRWALGLSPFHDVGMVPAQPAELGSAAVMLALGLVSCALAVAAFARRDVVTG